MLSKWKKGYLLPFGDIGPQEIHAKASAKYFGIGKLIIIVIFHNGTNPIKLPDPKFLDTLLELLKVLK